MIKVWSGILMFSLLLVISTKTEAQIVIDPDIPVFCVGSTVDLSYTGNGEKVYRIYRKAQNLQPENIGEYWYKLGLALFDGGYFSESETAFRYAARYGPDEDRFINYCWLGHLQDFRGNRPDAIINYTKALEFWDNDSYTHSQYNMKVNKNWVEERLQSPFSLGKPLSW